MMMSIDDSFIVVYDDDDVYPLLSLGNDQGGDAANHFLKGHLPDWKGIYVYLNIGFLQHGML